MTEESILVGKVHVNYKTEGIGPSVLILHGWGGKSDSWESVGKILSKNGFNVIIPDLPGFGKSDLPDFAWSVGDYLDFILKFIDFLESSKKISKPFYLIGHSFGGRISIKLAAVYPEMLKKLVLCSAAGITSKSIKTRLFYLFSKAGGLIFSFGFFAPLEKFLRKAIYRLAGTRDYLRANNQMKEVMRRVISEDLTEFISQIKMPTLIVWGKNDKVLPLKMGKIMKEKISGSTIEIIEDAGHAPNIESPDIIAASILRWFAKP